MATTLNDVEKVSALLEEGVDPSCIDERFRTPLHISASRGYLDIVR